MVYFWRVFKAYVKVKTRVTFTLNSYAVTVPFGCDVIVVQFAESATRDR
jgi:hypothetical protein